MEPSPVISSPVLADGADMWRMARACGLDVNSPYKYLLFCRDFAATSAIARVDDEPAGFVTGYRRPSSEALFIWQIGVADQFRKRGVALAMLIDLHQRGGVPVSFVEATVTPDNQASWRLFQTFADRVGTTWGTEPLFPAELFPEPHEPEVLLRIGPIHRRVPGSPTPKRGAS